MTTDRAQRRDEKNGVICLVIMFTSKVIVIKMSKMAYFYFLLMPKKKSQFGQVQIKDLTEFFNKLSSLKNGMLLELLFVRY